MAADNFYNQFNGRPFNSLEPARCRLAYIRGLHFDGNSSTTTAPSVSSHHWGGDDNNLNLLGDIAANVSDLPSCPVSRCDNDLL